MGVSKKRWAFMLASMVVLMGLGLKGPGVSIANADQFTMPPSDGCVTGFTLYEGTITNVAWLGITYHLTVPGSSPVTIVQVGWQNKGTGEVATNHWYMGATDRQVEFWDGYGSGNESWTEVRFVRGATGTMRFRAVKPASYGGCFYVDRVVVTRAYWQEADPTPPPGGGGGGGVLPTPHPSATATPAHPTPGATVTPGPGATCMPISGACYALPPAGYCYVDTGVPTIGVIMSPCTSPAPTVTPGPTATPGPWCAARSDGICLYPGTYTWLGADEGSNGTPLCAGGAPVNNGDDKVLIGPLGTYPAAGTSMQYRIEYDGGSVTGCNDAHTGSEPGFSMFTRVNGDPTLAACGASLGKNQDEAGVYTGTFTVSASCGGQQVGFVIEFTDDRYDASFTFAYGEVWPVGTAPGSASPTPSVTPTPGPGATSTPPSGFPSPGNDGDPDSDGDGPGGAVELCGPDDANLIVCSEVPSFGVPDASGAQDAFADLLSDMGEKAPFGYAVQISEALEDATTDAGAGESDYCFDIPQWTAEGTTDVAACIPLQEFATQAATVRSILLVMVTLLVGVSLLRAVSRSAPGG